MEITGQVGPASVTGKVTVEVIHRIELHQDRQPAPHVRVNGFPRLVRESQAADVRDPVEKVLEGAWTGNADEILDPLQEAAMTPLLELAQLIQAFFLLRAE